MMRAKDYLVSVAGGSVTWLSEDGEVLLAIPVPPGRVPARHYLGFCPDAAQIELSPGLSLVSPASISGRQNYGDARHESGANPDFRPTSSDRMQRELRLTLNRMQAATARAEARERALAKVERMPKAKVELELEEIEPQTKPVAEKPAKPNGDDQAVE